MNKTLIFISSVQKELAEERRAVRDFVRGDPLLRRFFDVFLFEDIPATDRRADEAIVNAVTHRDYTSNASVQVMLFADRLEVWNPGELPPPLTVAGLRRPHASIPHNPLIADPMFLATYAEKAGSGILDMMQLCRHAGLREPTFRQDGGQFVQTIWRPKAATEPATPASRPGAAVPEQPVSSTSAVPVQCQSMDERIIAFLARGALPISLISRQLGQARVSGQLKVVLKRLMNDRTVEFTIPNRPNSRMQRYRLTAKGRKWIEKHGA